MLNTTEFIGIVAGCWKVQKLRGRSVKEKRQYVTNDATIHRRRRRRRQLLKDSLTDCFSDTLSPRFDSVT